MDVVPVVVAGLEDRDYMIADCDRLEVHFVGQLGKQIELRTRAVRAVRNWMVSVRPTRYGHP